MLLIVVVHAGARAQIYNTGILHISSGTTLSSMGNFTNTSSADYLNNGSMYISGNIVNDQASLPAGTGVTFLNGTSPQTLGGAADFRTFSLTMNNASGLTLSRRLGIGDGAAGTLTFLAGTITTGTNTQDVYFYPGSGYTGFDATHNIIGFATKSGNSDFTFPIGDGSHQADIDLTALSGTADFQVIYAGTPYSTYTISSPLTSVFKKEWWDIQRIAGSATAKVTLKWDDTRNTLNHTDPTHLTVAHFTGGSWHSEGGSSSDPMSSSTGSVGPSGDVSSFSPFAIGSTTVALPIILSSFTVTGKDCRAALAWHTATEENAAGFEIQQSTNGIDYTELAYMSAKGAPSDYALSVTQDTRQAWYRLRMVDLDGKSVYSTVAGLQLDCMQENLEVYPNPSEPGSVMTVRLTSPVDRGNVTLQVFDMTGKMVYSTGVQVSDGVNNYTLPTSAWAPGAYFVLVTGNGWKSPHANFLLRRN